MELKISTKNPQLAQSIRETEWPNGLSIKEQPRDAFLSEGYEEIFEFVFGVAEDLIPFLAPLLFKVLNKTKPKKITIGKTEHIIPSEGQMYEVLKNHYDADNAQIETGFL